MESVGVAINPDGTDPASTFTGKEAMAIGGFSGATDYVAKELMVATEMTSPPPITDWVSHPDRVEARRKAGIAVPVPTIVANSYTLGRLLGMAFVFEDQKNGTRPMTDLDLDLDITLLPQGSICIEANVEEENKLHQPQYNCEAPVNPATKEWRKGHVPSFNDDTDEIVPTWEVARSSLIAGGSKGISAAYSKAHRVTSASSPGGGPQRGPSKSLNPTHFLYEIAFGNHLILMQKTIEAHTLGGKKWGERPVDIRCSRAVCAKHTLRQWYKTDLLPAWAESAWLPDSGALLCGVGDRNRTIHHGMASSFWTGEDVTREKIRLGWSPSEGFKAVHELFSHLQNMLGERGYYWRTNFKANIIWDDTEKRKKIIVR